MTARQATIITHTLRFLELLEGAQAVEAVIHASVQGSMSLFGEVRPSFAEMSEAIKVCDERGWINGVVSRVKGVMKWNITDGGRAALLEMQ
jgi:hypothetical protein